ncbi:hypothetical protein F3087_40190 [Nocardia colli]|uniref:Uncharacterized protein n=1 Tax=Nocardia colli TaxID=2545717 RepID=A0A5N0DXN9_9NOCA|nr:GAF domain-containing protein [Nocardia colli]KAA8881892.1 hypothetical protein F3087_40190 [Nocardia colli]
MTVETLTPGVLSVAAVGDEPRGFAGCQRVLQRLFAKTPALYDHLNAVGVCDIVRAVRDRAEDLDLIIPTRSGPHQLLGRPVFGLAGDVHAVRMWLGPSSAEVPAVRPATGAIWDLGTQTLQQPSGITSLTGLAAEEYVPTMSIAELFQRAPTFDRHAEVLDLLYDPRAGDKLQFDVAVTQGSGRPGRWRITLRARDDARTRGAWLLIEDVTSADAPAAWMTLERAGLREAHRRAGTHLAVVQVEHTSISHWLTDPVPWIRWDYLFRPVDVFHPDDRERLAAAGEHLMSGEAAEVTVRALGYDGGYTLTSMLLYPYPGYANREIAIAEFARVDDTEPASNGHGVDVPLPEFSSPVGYDEQLRRSSGRRERVPTW